MRLHPEATSAPSRTSHRVSRMESGDSTARSVPTWPVLTPGGQPAPSIAPQQEASWPETVPQSSCFAAGLAVAGGSSGRNGSRSPAVAARRRSRAAPNDYADAKSWLCRPGRRMRAPSICRDHHCRRRRHADARGLDRRSERADRLLLRLPDGVDRRHAQQRHDRRPGGTERRDGPQFARFASRCRPYAPLYRQVTLAALRARPREWRPRADGSRPWLRRCARRVEPLSGTRQQRPRGRARRAFAGRDRAGRAHSARD